MTPLTAITTTLRKALTFSGRTARAEFLWFSLLAAAVLLALQGLVQFHIRPGRILGSLAITVVMLPLILPWAASAWRRLHDTGLPGWPVLIPLLVSMLGTPLFFLGWMIGGDAPPAPPMIALANLFFILALVSRYLALPAWTILAYLLARPSQPGANRFGPNPNEVST